MARTIVATGMPAVSWGAVLAGWLFAYAFAMLLYLFGAAIGITTMAALNDLNELKGGVALGTGTWMVGSWVIATFFGGWLAGRLSGRVDQSGGMMHGLVVWALSGVMTLLIGSLTASSIASTGVQAGAGLTQRAGAASAELQIPQALRDGVRKALQTQATRAAAQTRGPGASEEALRRSLDQLDDEPLNAITRSLVRGDRREVERVLSERTEWSDQQVRQITNGVAASLKGQFQSLLRQAGQAVEQAGDDASTALWALFCAGALGLASGAFGGVAGVRRTEQLYASAADAAHVREEYPAYAEHS